jgi:hypothetical protein
MASHRGNRGGRRPDQGRICCSVYAPTAPAKRRATSPSFRNKVRRKSWVSGQDRNLIMDNQSGVAESFKTEYRIPSQGE